MTHEHPPTLEATRRAPDLTSSLCIGLGQLLAVGFMAIHPSVHGSDLASAVDELAGMATRSAVVHGALIAIMLVVLHGFIGMSGYLGWHLGRVRAGVIAYAAGVVCMLGATLPSGFLIPRIAIRYADRPDADLEALRPVITLCHDLNQVLAQIGTVAWSAAILAWSCALLGRGRFARAFAVLGMLVSVVTVAGLLGGHLRLHVHGMGAVIAAHAVWSAGVAVWMLRLRSQAGKR